MQRGGVHGGRGSLADPMFGPERAVEAPLRDRGLNGDGTGPAVGHAPCGCTPPQQSPGSGKPTSPNGGCWRCLRCTVATCQGLRVPTDSGHCPQWPFCVFGGSEAAKHSAAGARGVCARGRDGPRVAMPRPRLQVAAQLLLDGSQCGIDPGLGLDRALARQLPVGCLQPMPCRRCLDRSPIRLSRLCW